MADPDLVAAAAHEVAQRAAEYPKRVLSGKMTAQAAIVDYQAWTCIHAWLESGQFASIAAGGHDRVTIVSWPEAVAAVDAALAGTVAKAGSKATRAMVATDPARAADLRARADALGVRACAIERIARLVRGRAQTIFYLNRQFHEWRISRKQAA